MSAAVWDGVEHATTDCRGTWAVEVATVPLWHDDETTGMRAICQVCAVVVEVRSWSRATDDPDDDVPVPEQHRPRMSLWRTPLGHTPEGVTERAAGLVLRGARWSSWYGSRHEPQLWTALLAGRVVGALERQRGPRGGTFYHWALTGPDGRASVTGEAKTRPAAARAIAAARADAYTPAPTPGPLNVLG